MNVSRKEAFIRKAIESVSRHDDEAPEVRRHVLERVRRIIDDELAGIDARVQARVSELFPEEAELTEEE